ncbi:MULTISPECIES: PPC domain-containing protein [Aquimarina]|uniref:PPC domain-containing protein n=1 Tax=Aquimarina TaxID=290174 RepID=UPI000D68A052|nr:MULTISPECIES: PPC domain-containing protein [Aquimarina]
MKRVINLSLIVFAVLLSTAVKASDFLSVKIENSSTINVSLTNISKGQKLYLKDYSGTILFNATLDAMPTYKKYFNFRTVENGVYFIETETEFDVRVTPVIKNTKGIALIENSTITIFKPKLLVENTLVKVMVTRTEETPLNVSIYDIDGALVFDEKIIGEEGEFIIQRTYNFSEVPSGKYDIHFRLKDRVFIKEVSI